jgi:hypothetical protein
MTQHDVTKWTMNDVYNQHIHVHPLTICVTFANKFVFATIFTTIKYSHIICHVF